VLFVEKEGFDALLDAAEIAAQFDLAIASTKDSSQNNRANTGSW
jgi:hypothetical protein